MHNFAAEKTRLQYGLFEQGETPRLLDEWQTIPILWDAVRFAVDQRQQMSQFILIGSATPLSREESGVIQHSGVGRRVRLQTQRWGMGGACRQYEKLVVF